MKSISFYITALLRIGLVVMAALAEAASRKLYEIRTRLVCKLYKRGIVAHVENNDCASMMNELPHAN